MGTCLLFWKAVCGILIAATPGAQTERRDGAVDLDSAPGAAPGRQWTWRYSFLRSPQVEDTRVLDPWLNFYSTFSITLPVRELFSVSVRVIFCVPLFRKTKPVKVCTPWSAAVKV